MLSNNIKITVAKICKCKLEENDLNKLNVDEKYLLFKIIKTQRLSSIFLQNKSIDFYSKNIELNEIKKIALFQSLNTKKILKDTEKVAKKLNSIGIDYCILKGIAMILIGNKDPNLRPVRDIDLLIYDKDFYKVRNCLESMGFRKDVNKNYRKDYYVKMNFLNDAGTCIEVHTRVTHKKHFKKCPLSHEIMKNKILKSLNGIDVYISRGKELEAHLFYHGTKKEDFNVGPLLLSDLYYLNRPKDKSNYIIDSMKLPKTYDFVHLALSKYFYGDSNLDTDQDELYDVLFFNPLRKENLNLFYLEYLIQSFKNFLFSVQDTSNSKNNFLDVFKKLYKGIFFLYQNNFDKEKRVYLKKINRLRNSLD